MKSGINKCTFKLSNRFKLYRFKSATETPPLPLLVLSWVGGASNTEEGGGGKRFQGEWTWIISCKISWSMALHTYSLLQCLHIIRVCLLLNLVLHDSSVSCHCVQESVDVDLRAWNTRVNWHAVLGYTSRWKGDPLSPWPGIPNLTSDCL